MNKILISLAWFVFLVGLSGSVSAQPTVVWAVSYDGGAGDYANGVAVDSDDNVIVTGKPSNGDYYTIKYDSSGNELWNRTYNDAGRANGVAVDSSGNVIVTGYSHLGEGYNPDYYTIKYDSNGTELWNRRYDGGHDVANGVAVDLGGNVIVTGQSNNGYYTIKYDASGNELWNRRYDGGVYYIRRGVVY